MAEVKELFDIAMDTKNRKRPSEGPQDSQGQRRTRSTATASLIPTPKGINYISTDDIRAYTIVENVASLPADRIFEAWSDDAAEGAYWLDLREILAFEAVKDPHQEKLHRSWLTVGAIHVLLKEHD